MPLHLGESVDPERILVVEDDDALRGTLAHTLGTICRDVRTAAIYTLGSGLGFLPGLLATAAARTNAVRTAFGFAVLYNVTVVAISIDGKMSPLLAAILMPLSSIASIAIVAGISSRKLPNNG